MLDDENATRAVSRHEGRTDGHDRGGGGSGGRGWGAVFLRFCHASLGAIEILTIGTKDSSRWAG